MKRLTFTLGAALIGSPALAHGGAHLHPHGFELGTAALAACAVLAVLWVAKRR
jgi:uncharacterized OsmC-like protein